MWVCKMTPEDGWNQEELKLISAALMLKQWGVCNVFDEMYVVAQNVLERKTEEAYMATKQFRELLES
nr:hypothetical protein [Tanacetum cinerariifolium]GEX09956.1 hypothetical protein [Tanacetum cinerariifolium]